jgi:hypothetical protein
MYKDVRVSREAGEGETGTVERLARAMPVKSPGAAVRERPCDALLLLTFRLRKQLLLQ